MRRHERMARRDIVGMMGAMRTFLLVIALTGFVSEASAEEVLPPSVGEVLAPLLEQSIELIGMSSVTVKDIQVDKSQIRVTVEPGGVVTLSSASHPVPGRWFEASASTTTPQVDAGVVRLVSKAFAENPYMPVTTGGAPPPQSQPQGIPPAQAPGRPWLGFVLIALVIVAAVLGVLRAHRSPGA